MRSFPPPASRLILALLALVFAGVCTPKVCADGVPPAVVIDTVDGWTLRAAVAEIRVAGFLASRDPASVPAHSFSTVWYERQPDGSFSSEGWTGTSFAVAARTIEARAGTTLFGHAAIRADLPETLPETGSLVPMANGLAVATSTSQSRPSSRPIKWNSWLRLPRGVRFRFRLRPLRSPRLAEEAIPTSLLEAVSRTSQLCSPACAVQRL